MLQSNLDIKAVTLVENKVKSTKRLCLASTHDRSGFNLVKIVASVPVKGEGNVQEELEDTDTEGPVTVTLRKEA